MTHDQILLRRRYQKRLWILRRGQKVRIDAAPVWRHVDKLRAEGWNYARIADVAGVSKEMLHQRLATIHKRRAWAILRVDRAAMFDVAPDDSQVPAIGAQRRVQALMALGWPAKDILPATCMAGQVIRPGRQTVSAQTWRAVRDSYDRLSMSRGTGKVALNRARREGWPPPLCWDDDDIDDPNAEAAAPRTRNDDRHGPHAELVEQVAAMTERGITVAAMAVRLGVSQRTILRCRAEIAGQTDFEETG